MVPAWGEPPHYRLYFESGSPLARRQLESLAELIDQRLMVKNIEYDSKRESERLGPVEIRQVPPNLLRERDEKLLKQRKEG